MREYVRAENLKYRHTPLRALAVLMPFACVFFAAWLTHHYFTVDSYNWWYIGMGPGCLGILCGIIGGKDRKKKNYTILSLPCDMGRIWDAKVLLAAAVSAGAMACSSLFTIVTGLLLEHGAKITFLIQPSLKAQIAAGFLIWLTTLWQIPFCLLLAQKTGTFVMFLIHMASYTIQASIVSLKPWFAVFPGAVTARLMCPVLNVLPNGLPAVEGQMTYSPKLMELWNFAVGIPASVLWFVLLWYLGRRWMKRQVV